MGSLAADSSEGKVGEEQDCTVISTALQGSGIYIAGALYYFIHRYDFLFSPTQKEYETANASAQESCFVL